MKKLICIVLTGILISSGLFAAEAPKNSDGDEQLKKAAAALILKTTEKAGDVADFAGEKGKQALGFLEQEAPTVMKEFLVFKFAEHAVWTSFWALIALIPIAGVTGSVIWMVIGLKHDDDHIYGPAILCTFFTLMITLFPVCRTIDNGLEAFKAKYAPRVYMLEKGIELLKK